MRNLPQRLREFADTLERMADYHGQRRQAPEHQREALFDAWNAEATT